MYKIVKTMKGVEFMKFEDKSIIIDKFIELAKKSKLNSEQKKRIVHIIENLNETTETKKKGLFYIMD